MIRVISESEPTARKDHDCDSCDWLCNGFGYVDFSFSDLRNIAKAKKQHWKIKKGQKYQKQINVCDGEIYTFKSIPEIHEICIKHDLYAE
jgi:hypothetical protein